MKTSGLSQMSTTIAEEEAPAGDHNGLDEGFVALDWVAGYGLSAQIWAQPDEGTIAR